MVVDGLFVTSLANSLFHLLVDRCSIHLIQDSKTKIRLCQRRTPTYVANTRANLSHLYSFFNLTMTFRSDSDFVLPYSYFEPTEHMNKDELTDKEEINYARGKTKTLFGSFPIANLNHFEKNTIHDEALNANKNEIFGLTLLT